MSRNSSIDVLLPTYNGSSYLRSQIESILSQSVIDFNLIIRDDGSSDSTVDIIEEFCKHDPRVINLSDSFGNLGLVKNIEYMLTNSDADLIFFSDQDDVWLPNKIEVFLQNYEFDNKVKLVHSNCYVTDVNLRIQSKFLNDKIASNRKFENSYFHYFVQGASTMISRKLKEKILPFPNDVYIHDRYFHIMAELFGERTYISTPTMLYRQHENNLIGTSSLFKKIVNFKISRRFFIKEDRALFISILKTNPANDNLKLYIKLTDERKNRLFKLRMMRKHCVSIRVKDFILLLLKN